MKVTKSKLQSAMEYLMTYGWAILIIAVVLGALFQLGIFNASSFTSRMQPGSCEVYRPNGSGSSISASLTGTCSGIPEFALIGVAGANGLAQITAKYPLTTFTVTMWAYLKGGGAGTILAMTTNPFNTNANQIDIGFINSGASVEANVWAGENDLNNVPPRYTTGGYVFVAFAYNGNGGTLSVNNQSSITLANTLYQPTFTQIDLGVGEGQGMNNLNGSIANVQLYDTSLGGSALKSLYLEGIGGAPIQIENITGWWPLNGNGNDYSGNNNAGQVESGGFTTYWINYYTPV